MSELKYPKNEHVWVGYHGRSGKLLYIITSKESRDYYFLYEATADGFKKLGKAREPPELVEKFKVYDRMKIE